MPPRFYKKGFTVLEVLLMVAFLILLAAVAILVFKPLK